MIDIHTVINYRAEAQHIDNLINNEFFGIKKPLSESERVNYNLVHFVLEGAIKHSQQLNSSTYWCNECKCEHLRHTPFTEFISKSLIKKHSKQLNDLSFTIL